MRCLRFLPFLVTAAAVVLLAGALWGPGRRIPVAGSAQTLPALAADARPDPAAMEVLQRAASRLEPPRLEWLRTSVWMRISLPRIAYEAEGSYILAPVERFRLELRTTHTGRSGGKSSNGGVLSVCDGRDLWLASRTGPEGWGKVSRLRVGAILDGPDSPVKMPGMRDHFLRGTVLRGLVPLMRSLQIELRWVRRESSAGEEVLTGMWHPSMMATLASSGSTWPEGLPKLCRLTLRGPTLWPARIEWLGDTDNRGRTPLLVEMEFRDPILGQRIREAEARRLFAFDAGGADVTDLTPKVVADLETAAQQIRHHVVASPPAPPAQKR